jgi:hypothetical protein
MARSEKPPVKKLETKKKAQTEDELDLKEYLGI